MKICILKRSGKVKFNAFRIFLHRFLMGMFRLYLDLSAPWLPRLLLPNSFPINCTCPVSKGTKRHRYPSCCSSFSDNFRELIIFNLFSFGWEGVFFFGSDYSSFLLKHWRFLGKVLVVNGSFYLKTSLLKLSTF